MTGAAPGASDLRPSFRLPFTIAHSLPGRLRLRLNPPGEESHLKGAATALEAVDGVKRVYIRVAGRSLIVEYERSWTDPEALLEAAVSAVPEDYGFKTVEAEMSMPAPINRVWEVIVDPRYFSLHLPEAVHVTDIRDSSHWLVEFKALRRRFQLEVRMVERWPEQRVVLHAEGSFTAKITITLSESGDNYTSARASGVSAAAGDARRTDRAVLFDAAAKRSPQPPRNRCGAGCRALEQLDGDETSGCYKRMLLSVRLFEFLANAVSDRFLDQQHQEKTHCCTPTFFTSSLYAFNVKVAPQVKQIVNAC